MNLRWILLAACVVAAACAAKGPARMARDRDRADPALQHVLQRLAVNPDDVEARLVLAEARRAARDPEGALVEAWKALAVDPASPKAHVLRARIYFDRGMLDQEIAAWRDALAAAPADVEARENLGHALLAAGDPAGAKAEYRRVLELAPDARAALYNLAQLATDAGDAAEARTLWTRYLDVDPVGEWAEKARAALASLPQEEPQ